METQNIEYKESWRDEYLKWICGFANAQGGTMFIGVNDEGNVVGVKDAKRLMEDIPNKVRDVLGVVVEVDLQRIESYPVMQEVLREALLNAIVHKDYSQSVPIQISVYDDKLMIWNCGILPENWTVETLVQKHGSFPFNPEIANAFFRAGEIESWGRGIEQMTLLNQQNGLPKPLFKHDGVGLWTILEYPQNVESAQAVAQHEPFNYERFVKELGQVCPSLPKSGHEAVYGVMQLCKDGATVSAMTDSMNDLPRRTFVRNFLKPLLDAGLLEMQYPERPNHPKQKYLLTPKGKAVLEKAKHE